MQLETIDTPAVIGYGQQVWDSLMQNPGGLDRADLEADTGLSEQQVNWGLRECRMHRGVPGKRSLVYLRADDLYVLQTDPAVTTDYAFGRLKDIYTRGATTRLSLQATSGGRSAAAMLTKAMAAGVATLEAYAAFTMAMVNPNAVVAHPGLTPGLPAATPTPALPAPAAATNGTQKGTTP